MKLDPLAVLSDHEISRIHEASLGILSHCGVHVGSPRMMESLAAKGLSVDPSSQVVRFSRSAVEDALSKIPSQFEIFDRGGRSLYALGTGFPRIAAGHNAVFWVDSDSGQTRPSRVRDVEEFARICEHLECIDMIGIPVMPQDVPNPRSSLLHGVRAVIRNSTKPVFFSTDNQPVNRAVIDLLQATFPGDLASQVYGISQLSPTSPLFWEGSVCDAILDTLTTGVPLAILPEPNAGVSAPYTLAGLLTVNNTECLSGLVMIQLLNPGHKVLYANSWTATDMHSGAALVGSTETSICRIAGAQLARYYMTPSHTTAPNSDNHAHDEQNAWEKSYSLLCAIGAGNDLVVNCGMFGTGLTCSHEQLVMDEEMAAMARRIAGGIEVSDSTIAAELIRKTGPRGDYLTSEDTLHRLRSGEFLEPRISVRRPFAVWSADGAKDSSLLARERARILASRPVPPLDSRRETRLQEILDQFSSAS